MGYPLYHTPLSHLCIRQFYLVADQVPLKHHVHLYQPLILYPAALLHDSTLVPSFPISATAIHYQLSNELLSHSN
jgi:hypothetical protein